MVREMKTSMVRPLVMARKTASQRIKKESPASVTDRDEDHSVENRMGINWVPGWYRSRL
jgi:hypothetical protein